MARKYTIKTQDKPYFVTFTIVEWVDVFTRNIYKDIFMESLVYCQKNKGLEVYAYCFMTNHIHLILGIKEDLLLQDAIRDLKSFTSRHIRKALEENHQESRKEWMLSIFKNLGKHNARNKDFQFWIQDNHPIELNTNEKLFQKLNYIHQNPVEAGFVEKPEDWLWSSAGSYAEIRQSPIELIYI